MQKSLIIGIVALLLLGAGGYAVWVNQVEAPSPEESSGTEMYEDVSNGFRFSHSKDTERSPVTTREIQLPVGSESVPVPSGSVKVGELVVSVVPYSELSKENAIADFFSCCTGVRYWYDSSENAWKAEDIKVYNEDGTYLEGADQYTPHPLTSNGACELKERFGSLDFYKVTSGDEGIPYDFYYFVLTDKGYAVRVLSPYDLKRDYSGYAESVRPDPVKIKAATDILSSFELFNGVSNVTPSCR